MKSLPDHAFNVHIDNLKPQVVVATSQAFGDRVREFNRSFMRLTVGHCGGSTGPSAIGGGGALLRQRPVCPYPAQAAHTDSGDVNSTANFSCVTPRLRDRIVEASDLLQIRNAFTQRDLRLPNR